MSQNTVSPLTFPPQIEVHVFYVALGYFISHLPCAPLPQALCGGIVPWVYLPVAGMMLLPVAAFGQRLAMSIFVGVESLDDRPYIAALIDQTMQKRLSERFL